MNEQSAILCGDDRMPSRHVREKGAYNLLGIALDSARRLATVLKEKGCQNGLSRYVFPAPIVTDHGQVNAWAIIQLNGNAGLTYVTADGQLYCHDRDDMVACMQGATVGFDRVPHYVPWYRHLSVYAYSPEWVQTLQEANDQMEAALELGAYSI